MSNLNITNEDNMALMARYPDGYFDLAIVDPPYGIGIANRTGCIGAKKGQGNITKYSKKMWDSNIPSRKYWEELFRVSKNQMVFGGNYFTEFLPPSRGWVVWIKPQPEGVSFAMSELCWTSFDRSIQNIRIDRTHTQNNTSNNRFLAKATAKIHPTQKPIKLYKWLLDKYAKPGDKILDTHLGSGSIAIACHDYGFDLTACELDADYYAAAMKRIEQHVSQQSLFSQAI